MKQKLLPVCTSIFRAVPIVASLLICGCHSTRVTESNRAAAVILTNCLPNAVKEATVAVFRKHQYSPARAEDDELAFEKPTNLATSVFYGDWYSGAVWRRVKVYQRQLEPSRILLDCDVYMVQQPEDPLFQKERQLKGRDSGCQEMLEEVAASLDQKGTD